MGLDGRFNDRGAKQQMKKLYQDEQWLREQYWEKKLNATQIAQICGVSRRTVSRWMNGFGIPHRPRGEAVSISRRREACYRDKEWLYEKYWGEQLSSPQMARLANTDADTILRWMKKYGIQKRSISEGVKIARKNKDYYGESYLLKVSRNIKEMWKDQQTRDKIIAGVKKAWLDGRIGNDEWHRKQSESLKRNWEEGNNRGEEYKRKMSESTKKRWVEGVIGDASWKSKVSKGVRAAWERGVFEGRCTEEYRNKLSRGLKKAWERGAFDGAFKSPSSIELEISEVLSACDIQFVSQYRPEGYSRIFDIYILPDILLEIQGDYWHGPLNPQNQKRDKEKAQWAEENGYKFVALWEHEIKKVGAWTLVQNKVLPLYED